MPLAEIILFIAVFFMTPLIILIYALEDSPYVYERLVGYRKRTPLEAKTHWVNLGLTLGGAWIIVGIICCLLEIFG